MKLPIVLRAEAEAEFDDSFDWFNAQRTGRGLEFAAAIQNVFNAITINPLIGPVIFADIRKCVVRRFTFNVYYRPHFDRIEVIAVFHTSRDPAIWKGRV